MIRRDMPEVLDIEQESFEYPWGEDDFIRCLRHRNCIGMVADTCVDPSAFDRVAGFMVYELHRTRLHLLNFAVGREFRRRGIGRAMVVKLKDKIAPGLRQRIALEVRETNVAAQLFWQAMGFRATSVVRDFYRDTDEDAYVFEYRARPTSDPRSLFVHG